MHTHPNPCPKHTYVPRQFARPGRSHAPYYVVVTLEWSSIFLSWEDAQKAINNTCIPVTGWHKFHTFAEAQAHCLRNAQSYGVHPRQPCPPVTPVARAVHPVPQIIPSPRTPAQPAASVDGPLTIDFGNLTLTVTPREQ